MGLFDQVAGMLLNGDAGKYQAILSWVNQQGGVQALLDKFRQGGFGDIVASWLSTSEANRLLSADQVIAALGSPALTELGAKLGIDMHAASAMVAQHLPNLIDALSPQGELHPEANNDLLKTGMALLKGKLFG
ncbi:YidB family protein [Franconibacter pulveris]|uniref:YidB family protein n=1 Tax=Franconibacter pulveris TaxID=435910 RepID=UPI0004952E82|nr:YidB family protein [Franconibacter pulveris]